jgi:hypothetical protein
MTTYAWTIKVHGRKDIQHVTMLAELHDYLRVLDLPGIATPEWVTVELEASEHVPQRREHGRMVADLDVG